VHFWRLPSGKDAQMSGYPLKPTALSWSADGKWLATGGGSQITLWPFDGKGPEGREPLVLDAHTDAITALAFAPRGRALASACRGGTLALWDVPRAEPALAVPLGKRVEQIVWCGARVLATIDDDLVAIDVGASS
jgi:WD40 repeat protein